jgi:hypothetical protein
MFKAFIVRLKPSNRNLSQRCQFIVSDVLTLVFCEAIKEHRTITGTLGDHQPIAARASLPFPRYPLLDNAAA